MRSLSVLCICVFCMRLSLCHARPWLTRHDDISVIDNERSYWTIFPFIIFFSKTPDALLLIAKGNKTADAQIESN